MGSTYKIKSVGPTLFYLMLFNIFYPICDNDNRHKKVLLHVITPTVKPVGSFWLMFNSFFMAFFLLENFFSWLFVFT